ncbi:serine hydrolase domain-containing protein [Cellulophaga omnivescoria]|uniref:serine hydrolase domain-containing protein n=1 Tax=Cellulophaga omnivescoria TaxID=1888890 RepID=UPI000986FDD8|nr:serine hydrolase domain-containing protein [Cellulophaga omnivescoria]
MKKIIVLIVVLSICISCSQKKSKTNNELQNPTQTAKDSLTAALDSIYKQGLTNGFGVAIVNDKGTLYKNGFGWADKANKIAYTENTVQHIASISKTLIGVALMKAHELGKLNLDDPIDKYIAFDVLNPNYPNKKITIQHLATHTSSIVDTKHYMQNAWILTPNQDLSKVYKNYPYQRLNPSTSAMQMEAFLKEVLTTKGKYYDKENGFLKHKPGEKFEYSNIGATLTALIIEKSTGIPFNEFTKKYILKPLKMNSAGWSLDEVDATKHSRLYYDLDIPLPFYTAITYPDGMLIASCDDMAKYLTELIKGYTGNGTLLNKKNYETLFTQYLSEDNFDKRNAKNPYNDEYNTGIFMGFSAKGYIGHTGGDAGVVSFMFFDKETKTGRYLIRNTNSDDDNGPVQFYNIWKKLGEYSPKLHQ